MRLAIAALLLATSATASASDLPRPVAFQSAAAPGSALVVPLADLESLARRPSIDPATRSAIERAVRAEDFKFEPRSTLMIRGLERWPHLLVIGTGSRPLDSIALQDIGGLAAQQLGKVKSPIAIIAEGLATQVAAPAAEIALGARLGSYRFDKYKSPGAEQRDTSAQPIVILGPAGSADAYDARSNPLAEAVGFARDLGNEPANILYPESFADRVKSALRGVPGVTVKLLDAARMEQLGMGSILAVGKGSQRPPVMVIVEYRGGGNAPLVALAGKGITFDSGGISIKPSSGMSAMKGDMAGAAAVVATAMSLAKSRAPVNLVAIAALAENMPSGSAARPGDVVRAINGKTIEILSTDAEGRLVLADAVAYAEREYRPAVIVDIATLTGSVRGALGDEYAGLLTRNDPLAGQLVAAGAATGEELWRLPLHPNYADDMKSDIADIKNVVEGGAPGAGFGAHFIGYFVESTPWAHLDIAGVDTRSKSLPTVPEGPSGFGVRLLDRFVRDFRPVPAAPAAD